MARSRRKNGGPTRGRFKKKKLGKGYLANRAERVGSRPVLRVTDAEATDASSSKKG